MYNFRVPVVKVSTKPPKGVFLLVSYKSTKERHPMRKLEKQMNFAISNKGNWNGSNTSVVYNEATNCSQVRLHGHLICTFCHNTLAVKLSSCGYETVTTKSRLNAILEEVKYGAKVFQKNFNWFVKYQNQTVDFIDGMILFNSNSLEVA